MNAAEEATRKVANHLLHEVGDNMSVELAEFDQKEHIWSVRIFANARGQPIPLDEVKLNGQLEIIEPPTRAKIKASLMEWLSDKATDDQLVSLMKDGDKQALGMFYKRHEKWLLWVARTKLSLKSSLEPEDLLNEFCVEKLMDCAFWAKFNGASKPITFVTSCFRKFCVGKLREEGAKKRSAVFYTDMSKYEHNSKAPVPDEILAAQEKPERIADVVKEVLDKLPTTTRTAFKMKVVDKMGIEEIARIMKWSKPTVSSRVSDAKRALKKALDAAGLAPAGYKSK